MKSWAVRKDRVRFLYSPQKITRSISIGGIRVLETWGCRFSRYSVIAFATKWKYSKDGQCVGLKIRRCRFKSYCFHNRFIAQLDRAPDYESEGLRCSRQGGIINRQYKREVEESGRPRWFWKPEFAGSNPASPTKNKNGEISVMANTAVCESVNTGFESRISPKGNTLTLES